MPDKGMGRNVARLRVAVCAALAGAALAAASPLRAEPPAPVVVELYTSQGCSSCPPADELLRDLAARDGIIALALHVDYWDYIGWADSFARPEHTARQKAYARASGEQMIYTPQIIIAGQTRVLGAKAMAVVSAIEAHGEADGHIAVALERTGDTLRARLEPRVAPGSDLLVQVVRYMPEAEVEVLRGENAGRTLHYANIVTAWDVVAEWDGRAPLELDIDVSGEAPAVVIVQESGHGAILGAAAHR